CFFFSSRRRHTRFSRDWSSDVCSSDLAEVNSRKIIDGYDFLISIAPETHAANLEAYTATINESGIEDFQHKGMVLEITYLDGNCYEYFGVDKKMYLKLVNSENLNRFAKGNIYWKFFYSNTKLSMQDV